MPTQKDIAIRAGLTQATVSMALRNHPAINEKTRALVHRIAEEIDYRPNPLVSSLMMHIRSRRQVRDQGTLAVIVASEMIHGTPEKWIEAEVYGSQLQGVRNRAEKLGYRVECFFADQFGSASRLDQVLYARGMVGVLLLPPQNLPRSPIRLRWKNYAYAAVAYSWGDLPVHRAAAYHRYNMELAFEELMARGYERIGLSLPPEAVEGVDANWLLGFLHWKWKYPAKAAIPLFVVPHEPESLERFSRWYERHRPDVILCLSGFELRWLAEMGVKVPGDVSLACVNRPRKSGLSGVDENHEEVGTAAADLLIHQTQSNERGFPAFPHLLLIKGTWVEGASLSRKPRNRQRS